MSTKNVKKPRQGLYDTRSFIEIWFQLPPLGRRFLGESLRSGGITKQAYYKWLEGAIPQTKTVKIIQKVLAQHPFNLKTHPLYLFPSKEAIKELVNKYNPKEEWDGEVNWPSLNEEEESND